MTNKQKQLIEEIKECGAIFVEIEFSFKDTPENVECAMVKLKPYDETDPCDVANDDNVFYYFNGLGEFIESFDRGNSMFEFTTLAITSYNDYGIAYDKNGFEIKRGDKVFWTNTETKEIIDGCIVYGDPDEEKTNISLSGSNRDVLPEECELDYASIIVKVSSIKWSDDAKKLNQELPESKDILFTDIIYDYLISDFSNKKEVFNSISYYLYDLYEYAPVSLEFTFNRRVKKV